MKYKFLFILTLLFITSFVFTGCVPDDDEIERPAITAAYDGNYSVTGCYYNYGSTNRLFTIVKSAVNSGPNMIDIDAADRGALGYKLRITVDPIANRALVVAAPGAAGAPYTQLDTGMPASNPGPGILWINSALCNNTYNPVSRTFFLRYGFVTAIGWAFAEEIMVHQ